MKNFIKKIPGIRWFLDIRRELALIRFQLTKQTRIQQHIFREQLISRKTESGSGFPAAHEQQTFSQNGEDGILLEIFSRLGISKGTFLEIGTGDGNENNTRLLLELGWSGIWIEGDETSCQTARNNFAEFIDSGSLRIINAYVTPDDIDDLLNREGVPKEVDLLSLDIDMDTHHVWENMNSLEAKIAVVEYNGFFPSPAKWKSKYVPGGKWDGTYKVGATLGVLTEIATTKRLRHLGCELTGTNAFFGSIEIAEEHFPETIQEKDLFEPARHFLLNDPEH